MMTLPSRQTTVKSKENKKKAKYLDFAWELKKKQRNMKVTVIPIVISALGTIHKSKETRK